MYNVHVQCAHALLEVGSLLPPLRVFQESNSGCQTYIASASVRGAISLALIWLLLCGCGCLGVNHETRRGSTREGKEVLEKNMAESEKG